jgi:hypothetical protein
MEAKVRFCRIGGRLERDARSIFSVLMAHDPTDTLKGSPAQHARQGGMQLL